MSSNNKVGTPTGHAPGMPASPDKRDQADDVTALEIEMVNVAENTDHIKPSPWTLSMLRLYGVLFCAYFGAGTNGYDGSVMGGLNAMASYQQYFNMETASASTGLVFAIYGIGTIAGLPLVGPVNDYFGRRAGMFTGATIVIIGTLVISQSLNTGMFLGGRFILGFGVGFCNISAPVYVGEMAHPYWRGTLMGIYSSFGGIGSIVATWVVYAAQYRGWSGWRLPLWCQLIPSGILFTFVWTLPESPRWLVAQGRLRSAKEVLVRYHGEGDSNHPLVKLQMAEMEAQISTVGSDKRWWDYRELWSTRPARRRLLCVLTMATFGQWSGSSLTSAYLPVMLENAGITSQQKKLMLNGIFTVLTFLANLCGARLMDKVGRRPLLLGTLSFCIVCFAIIVPTSKFAIENPHNSAIANTTVAFIYLFGLSIYLAWAPLSPMYIVEVLDTNTRAKGKSLAQLFTAVASTVITYSSSPAFAALKYYIYLIFIGWDLLELTVIYFFWPETKGRTLEELEEVFSAPNPVKKSLEPKTSQTVVNTMKAGAEDLEMRNAANAA
ncbi:Major facilitator superfamily domain general substrate transporter [Penicillium malachiteum]|uniref:Major facilitator superfamily domain general substrate transporter n=1 Tax=Penicillium malachiteum TaxID=1324776 RepID=UPI002546BEF7|nr:Major facilitator superfamily domain general substrate transporter [Penicillium malachiteum]KAJ5737237.1 Major facilitator superfamily domain general substrate transporter [Penicillium malachiteum]